MTSTEIASASKIILGTTEADAMYIGSMLIWQKSGGGQQEHDYSQDYFTIESLEDNNTISINKTKSPPNINLSYSTDNGETWTDLNNVSSTTTFTTINIGDKIIFKGINNSFSNAWDTYYRFNASKNFKVYGNAMSLLWGDDFLSNSEFSNKSHNLCGLFYGATKLIDASNLILPATILNASSYNGMFRGCTNLTTAPQLPATQSAQDCYSSMFEGCINLEVAPEINLVNLSTACCKRMFCMDRSNKLTTPKMTKSPILRCATSAASCYEEMFKGNGNLVEVTCLLSNAIYNNCVANWLTNCSTTGTFIKASGSTWNSNTSGIPSDWTVEDYVES